MVRHLCRAFVAIMLLGVTEMALAQTPIVIAHRGASADRPEHTLAAYRLAIAQGADFIEPDLVPTGDGHLVARHENAIHDTTNVAQLPEFANRKTTKIIDDQKITGWFTEDFTLAELKTLLARERLPVLRSRNDAHADERIPTFDEILALVAEEEKRLGRRIGVYPETKHPAYFRAIGLPLEDALLEALARYGYTEKQDPVFIQSFEVENLKSLRRRTSLRLIQLMGGDGGPSDRPELRYADMATAAGLNQIAEYADGIGVERSMVIPRTMRGRLKQPTTIVQDAHAAGLQVHVWTFRPENYFLPRPYRKGLAPGARGDAIGEIRAFLATGIDGIFTDSVPDGVTAVGGRK